MVYIIHENVTWCQVVPWSSWVWCTSSMKTGIEDTRHYLLNCPFYASHREVLVTSVENIIRGKNLEQSTNSLDLFLYGDPSLSNSENQCIISATLKFIENSNRLSSWTCPQFALPFPPFVYFNLSVPICLFVLCLEFFYFFFCKFFRLLNVCMFLEAPGWVIIKIHPPGACTFSEKKVLRENEFAHLCHV